MSESPKTEGIGTLRETSLHASLKEWYARPGDNLETEVDGYLIDVMGDSCLTEIQTGSFSALKQKLSRLLPRYPVRVIHPIAQERWICRVTAADQPLTRRKSPRRGRVEDLFNELVSLVDLAAEPNFSLEIVLIQEEVVWRDDGRGSWRRKGWSVADRRLLQVLDRQLFSDPAAYLDLLPADLADPFTNRELAHSLKLPARLAGRMTYTLRRMGVLALAGKDGRAYLHVRNLSKES